MLTLFFTEVSTIPWKIVQITPEELNFHWNAGTNLAEFSLNSSTTFWYWELMWLPKKFAMTELKDNQAKSSSGFSASSKLVFLMSSLIWGPLNIPALSFYMLFRWNFWRKKANPQPSLSNAFTKFFMRSSLMRRGGSNILLGSARRWDRTMCDQVLILSLTVTLVWHNAVINTTIPSAEKAWMLWVTTLKS